VAWGFVRVRVRVRVNPNPNPNPNPNIHEVAWGFGACALCVIAPGICCGSYSPCGAFDRPTGCARDEARNGAIGATALKWLSMFLRGEEQGEGPERPIIASGWECVGLDMSRV